MIKYDISLDTEYLKPSAIPSYWVDVKDMSLVKSIGLARRIRKAHPNIDHAFIVTEWDDDNIGEDGAPELISQLNVIDFIEQGS